MNAHLEGEEVVLRMSIQEARWACKNDGIELKQTESLGAFAPNSLHERYNLIFNCLKEHQNYLLREAMNSFDSERCIEVLKTIAKGCSSKDYMTINQIADDSDIKRDLVIEIILWFRDYATGAVFVDCNQQVDGDTKCYSTGAVNYWLYLLNSLDRDYV